MTVVSLKNENSRGDGVVKVEFSDGTSVVFSTDYLPEGELLLEEQDFGSWVGRELSSGEEEVFLRAAIRYQAEKVALRLIARAEQNSLGLIAKLERRGYDAAAVKAVVSHLLDRNLVNDGRYAELWIRSRLASGKAVSPRWLLVSLGKRGIDKSSSHRALARVLDDETEYVLLLKYVEQSGVSENKKTRSLRADLKYEGFSFETLNRFFND